MESEGGRTDNKNRDEKKGYGTDSSTKSHDRSDSTTDNKSENRSSNRTDNISDNESDDNMSNKSGNSSDNRSGNRSDNKSGTNQSQGANSARGMQGSTSNATGVNSSGVADSREMMGDKCSINQEAESKYWREAHSTRKYVKNGQGFEEYEPAYRMGWECASKAGSEKTFDMAEPKMKSQWESSKDESGLTWDNAKMAVRDAWERVKESAQGSTSSSSKNDARR